MYLQCNRMDLLWICTDLQWICYGIVRVFILTVRPTPNKIATLLGGGGGQLIVTGLQFVACGWQWH